MVDLNTAPRTSPANGEERSKIKGFIGRAPGIGVLKSKFLTVLGNSNELLNGISSKFALNISSSDSEYCDDEEEQLAKFDDTIDWTKIDYESRRIKARRAHEELMSGRYRYPHLMTKNGGELKHRLVTAAGRSKARTRSSSSSASTSSSSTSSSHSLSANLVDRSHLSSTTCSQSIDSSSRHSGGYGRPGRVIAGARRSDLDIQRDLLRIKDLLNPPGSGAAATAPCAAVKVPTNTPLFEDKLEANAVAEHLAGGVTGDISMWVPTLRGRPSNSSTLTSLHDETGSQASPSVESNNTTDWRNFIRSESQNSVPSWASSISLDCRTGEEPVKEFMQRFVEVLFTNATAITLELKAEFGELSHADVGRQWFARCLVAQKVRSKRIDELTFHSLLQYLAIVLFECNDAGDYVPAMIIMNLCFLFYHDIEVPGCEAYREYLYTFMRQQPIWGMLRFWTAAFADTVQAEFERRLTASQKRAERKTEEHALAKAEDALRSLEVHQRPQRKSFDAGSPAGVTACDASSSNSSSHNRNALPTRKDKAEREKKSTVNETQLQESIVLRQLGTFTCNMHALGVPQVACLEFLRKQTASLNIATEKVQPIQENVARMYRETDQWGAKDC